MIEALDETIKQLLVQKMPLNLAEVDVSFDVPNREWSGSISKPTINIYLHDIRENLELRGNEWTTTHDFKGRTTRTKRGQFFDISYLITAWTTNVEDEHRLLWYVLATLVRNEPIPVDVMQGELSRQPTMLIRTGRPDGILRNAADVWTALDNQLKPVIPYIVTLYLEPHIFEVATQVRSKFIRLYEPLNSDQILANGKLEGYPPPQIESEVFQFGGYITDAVEPERTVTRAEVVLVEQGLNTSTDREGRYTFKNVVKRPQYTFLVVAPGYVTVRQVLKIPSASYDFKLQPEAEAVKP